MRLVFLSLLLLVLACCSTHGQAQRYHEKTRFDRSVSSDQLQWKHNRHLEINKKQRTITDPATQFTAYKDSHLNVCYLEKLQANELDDAKLWIDIIRGHKKVVFATNRPLKKIEAWHLAGQKIVDFCKGTSMFLLQESMPTRHEDPAFNQILEEKITIVKKAPHDERVKREAKARFRGQTQTQYMNLGGDGQNEGRAEAEATLQSSHAVVTGSSGMGQAQSMSSGSDGCEGCLGVSGTYQGFPTGVEN